MEPYYTRIKDSDTFLRHYRCIYRGDYAKARAEKIVELIPKLQNRITLDLGCGGGFYSLAAAERSARNIVLVDLSCVCVKAAKDNLLDSAGQQSEGIVADVTYLPLRSQCFDFLLAVDIIEHLERDDLFVSEVSRVLGIGGVLLIATQNSNSLNFFLETLLYRYILGNRRWMGWDPTHIRFYSPKRLVAFLRHASLIAVEIAGTYFIPYLLVAELGKSHPKLFSALCSVLKTVNRKTESGKGHFWRIFGWGIVCKCLRIANVTRRFHEDSSAMRESMIGNVAKRTNDI